MRANLPSMDRDGRTARLGAGLLLSAVVGLGLTGCGGDDASGTDGGVALSDAARADARTPVLDGGPASDAAAGTDAGTPVDDAGAPAQLALGVSGHRFTVDGVETFLLGVSYFDAIAASEDFVRADFDQLAALRINHVRVFAAWNGLTLASSVLRPDGSVDAGALGRLVRIVDLARERGIIVDVTFARGIPGASDGTFEAYRDAIVLVTGALLDRRNLFFDLGNEHDIADSRHIAQTEVDQLVLAIHAVDATRLLTASIGGNDAAGAAAIYVPLIDDAHIDFVTPHFARTDDWAAATQGRVEGLRTALVAGGYDVPIHLQEENRRSYAGRDPTKDELLAAAAGARAGDAAAWNLHTGAGFELTMTRLFDRLDPVELDAIDELATAVGR